MKAVVFAYSNVGDRCLRVLRARGVDVKLVVTHRDDPNEQLWFSRVSDTATELGIPFIYRDGPADDDLLGTIAELEPDLVFSFYYRAMLPPALLDLAPSGAFNMHGSLLPAYRGRAPTNWAVLHGETTTGATLHFMVAKADAGDIVDQQAVPILPDDTARQVFDKVTVAAEQVLWRALPSILAGRPTRRANDIAAGSYFGRRTPEDGRIDWRRDAADVYNLIRAVAPPYPGAFTEVAGVRVVVAEARLASAPAAAAGIDPRPGLAIAGGRIVGVCGDGKCIDVRALHVGAHAIDAILLSELLAADRNLAHS